MSPVMLKVWRTSSSSARLFGFFSHRELDADESELLLFDIVHFKEERMVSIYKKCKLPEELLINRGEHSKTRLLAMHASPSLHGKMFLHIYISP